MIQCEHRTRELHGGRCVARVRDYIRGAENEGRRSGGREAWEDERSHGNMIVGVDDGVIKNARPRRQT